MGRKSKDRCREEKGSGIETSNADSNYADDRKSQNEVKDMIASTHTRKHLEKLIINPFSKKKRTPSIFDNITYICHKIKNNILAI